VNPFGQHKSSFGSSDNPVSNLRKKM